MKRLLATVLISIVPMAAACKKKEGDANKEAAKVAPAQPAPPPEEKKPEPPKPLTADEMAKRYDECWGFYNARDWKSFETCYAPGATSDFVDSGMPPATGFAEIQEKHSKPFLDAFPDAKGTVELTLISGRNAATVALYTGTHTAPLKSPMGEIPPTNKKIGMRVAHMAHFTDDGHAVDKQWFYNDIGTMMSQLGLSPAPARPVTETANPHETVVAKDDDTEKKNLATVTTLGDAFNKHDTKAIDAVLADDLKWGEIGMPKDWNKKEAVAAHGELFKGFPDLKFTPGTQFAAGDWVVQQGVMTGTNKGDMPTMHIKKTGKPVNLNYLQFWKFNKDGKIAESWGYWNGAAMAMQLGMMPPPGGAAPAGAGSAAKPGDKAADKKPADKPAGK